ncbi:MAG: sulfotransferase domain-containing protein [Alphaproteobacteria bacterium]
MHAFQEIIQGLLTKEGVGTGLAFALRPTDVVITPFGKSGTTWLQQMAHCLRTRGDMDFDDISRVVPWIETSTDLGLDLNAEQKASPRAFKSHLDADAIPKGGRYIVSSRNPQDALYSMFKFMEGWFIEPGAVTPDAFARATWLKPGSGRDGYWKHLKSWWLRRDDPDVLFMAYEHMKDDLTGTIQKVAEFMDITLDDELLAITQEHASLPFMQRHKDKFDDKLMRERATAVCGIPADSDSSKVRTGKVGEARQKFSDGVLAELDAVWQREITAELGFPDYATMIATLD